MKTEFQKCEICGKVFIPVGRHKYCEPCIAFMKKEKETHSRRGHKQVQKKTSLKKSGHKYKIGPDDKIAAEIKKKIEKNSTV